LQNRYFFRSSGYFFIGFDDFDAVIPFAFLAFRYLPTYFLSTIWSGFLTVTNI
jgi:hypothetical protein